MIGLIRCLWKRIRSAIDECTREHVHGKFERIEKHLRTLSKRELEYEIIRYKAKKDALMATLSAAAVVFAFLSVVIAQKPNNIPLIIWMLTISLLILARLAVRKWSQLIFIAEKVLREMEREERRVTQVNWVALPLVVLDLNLVGVRMPQPVWDADSPLDA